MRRFVIINSEQDPAGKNILQRIIELGGFREIDLLYDSLPVYSRNNVFLASSRKHITEVGSELDEVFGSRDTHYVFVSRHRAESSVPSLTAHFTGNFGQGEFGGNPKEIARYSPSVLKRYMIELESLRSEIQQKYSITLEATHHGPTSLKCPSMFVELGSTETEWSDQQAASNIASALLKSLENFDAYKSCAIGLGGTHYPAKFTKLTLESTIALGVIVPKYSLELIDEAMLSQIIQKSEEKITIATVDNKGLGKYKERILSLAKQVGLEVLRV
jgi:D-aminoacyl-tRNA deacylase